MEVDSGPTTDVPFPDAGPVGAGCSEDLRTTLDSIGTGLNGQRSAESEGNFGMTVWGYDSYASYAYPAGGNARTLRELPPLL
ncbi:MAG: hypothetical protein ACI9KE_006311 [Polyangiales bacterium]|jgi:hypothetical protein